MNEMMKPAKPQSARERILWVAHDLFYREGIRATGIDRIIAESSVAKVTFYRHFPSKNDLVIEFLEYRHKNWMTWFGNALQRHGNTLNALVPTLKEWFASSEFRGCAFINSVVELGQSIPEIMQITRRHKNEMVEVIANLLPPSRKRNQDAQDLALAIDGAIIRAQYDEIDTALRSLKRLQKSLLQ